MYIGLVEQKPSIREQTFIDTLQPISQRQQGEFIDVSRWAVASLSLGKKIC